MTSRSNPPKQENTSLPKGPIVPRAGLLIIAVWAVVAAPALCVAGVLAHECRCEDEIACDHESACESDPCGELLVRRDASFEHSILAELASALPVTHLERPSNRGGLPRAHGHPCPLPPVGVRHASDLPLLS